MKLLIFASFVLHLAWGLSFHSNFREHKELQPLCELGCECPTTGLGLMFLDCSRKRITKLPTSLRLEAPLTTVSFEGNQLTTLEMSTFTEASQVQELDLSLNQITAVGDYALAPFISLAVLRLSHNRLSSVMPGLLERLNNLRVLELGHNNIQELSHLAFQATPHLQEIRLQYNPLFSIPEDLFRYVPKLERLDLQETGLVELPQGLFTNTPGLHWLSLSNNAFETVPETALQEARMLDSLDLSGNDFVVLEEGSFSKMERLSLLYLNNLLSLIKVERDAFAGLSSLKTLSCSYNPKLSFVDKNAFGGENSTYSKTKTPPKERFYLRQNALRTLASPLEASHWSSLSFVDFADNPWKCDCNLEWMTQLRKEVQMNVECKGPPHLKGQTLDTVKKEDLRCSDQWHFITFVLVVSSMVAFSIVFLAASAVVCSRTPLGLKIRAKYQFGYAKVVPKTETVDLEWDPSADV